MLTQLSPDDLRQVGKALRDHAKILDELADRIEQSKMQEFYYHWVTFSNMTSNGIADFLDELNTAINKQVRAFSQGKSNPYKREIQKAQKDPRTRAGKHKAEQESPPKKPAKRGA